MRLNVVGARTGLTWVRTGLRTYFRQPLALTGLFFMYTMAIVLLAQIPVLGPLAGGLLVPAASLGLMAATAEADRGRFPMPSVLLSAFRAGRQQLRAMLTLGAIYAGASLLATALATLVAGAPTPVAAPTTPNAPAGADMGPSFDPAMLLALALHLPLFLMFWHAPALVHWHGVSPTKSLFFSVVAVLRNLGAHTLFIAGWVVIFLVAGTVFGVLGGLIGGPSVVQAITLPMALVLASMFSSSVYFSFLGSFQTSEPAAVDPSPGPGPGPDINPPA
jgi:hypothetical protein